MGPSLASPFNPLCILSFSKPVKELCQTKKTVPFLDERRPENKVCESEIYNVYGICYLRDLLLSELREELEEPDELRPPEEDGLDSDLPDETDELLLL